MKFKIDENLPIDIADILFQKGHDAKSVIDQNLSGEDDPDIAAICQNEERTLITLDTDFGDIRTYPPKEYPGIIVFRLKQQDKPHILHTFTSVVYLLSSEPLNKHLWIVDEDRVRIRG